VSPAERAAELRRLIDRANIAYYVHDAPEISDAEYDRCSGNCARSNGPPELATPTAHPAHRAEPATALRKHTHLRPMLSLGKRFRRRRTRRLGRPQRPINAGRAPRRYTTEIKIDGAAVNLTTPAPVVTGALAATAPSAKT